MKSEFRFSTILAVLFVAFIFFVGAFFNIQTFIKDGFEFSLHNIALYLLFLIGLGGSLVAVIYFGKTIEIIDSKIIIHYIFRGKSFEYFFSELEGYKIEIQYSQFKDHKSLVLRTKDGAQFQFSEFEYANFALISNAITTKTKLDDTIKTKTKLIYLTSVTLVLIFAVVIKLTKK